MFSSNLEALKIQKFPSPLAPTMVGPAGDTELSKSLHVFFANRFLILNWNPGMYFRMNLKMKKPTLFCCFTWMAFIELNCTVPFMLIKKNLG